MLNYGNECRSDEIDRFVERYTLKFGQKFLPWRVKEKYETYRDRISTASVYIAPLKTQTGLGIAYLMLKWGRKVYVRGNNFTWLKYCGFKVFDLDTCVLSDANKLLEPLTSEEKQHNGDVWAKMFDPTASSAKWDSVYCHTDVHIRSLK